MTEKFNECSKTMCSQLALFKKFEAARPIPNNLLFSGQMSRTWQGQMHIGKWHVITFGSPMPMPFWGCSWTHYLAEDEVDVAREIFSLTSILISSSLGPSFSNEIGRFINIHKIMSQRSYNISGKCTRKPEFEIVHFKVLGW